MCLHRIHVKYKYFSYSWSFHSKYRKSASKGRRKSDNEDTLNETLRKSQGLEISDDGRKKVGCRVGLMLVKEGFSSMKSIQIT